MTNIDELSKRIAALSPARRSLLERVLKDRMKLECPEQREERKFSYLVKLQSGRGPTSIFCVLFSGGFKNEILSFVKLAPLIGQHYSCYVLFARGTNGISPPHRSVQAMAAAYIEEMKVVQPNGPYFIVGECFSAPVAYEMAQQLGSNGDTVGLLAFLDALGTRSSWNRYLGNRMGGYVRYHIVCLGELSGWRYVKGRAAFHYGQLRNPHSQGRLRYLVAIMRRLGRRIITSESRTAKPSEQVAPATPRYRTAPPSKHLQRAHKAYGLAVRRYEPKPYMGPITVIASEEKCRSNPTLGWVAQGGVEVYSIPGTHNTYLRDHSQMVASILRAGIHRAEIKYLTSQRLTEPAGTQS
jgi:hypothetical protein